MVRFDPFKEIEDLQERLFRGYTNRPETRTFAPMVDVMEDGSGLHFAIYLPGIDPEKVEVNTENNTLTVKAERPFVKPEGANQYRLEGTYGSFARSFTVPSTFELAKAEANFKNGVLYIDLPKAEAAQPRKIEVRVNA